MCGIVEKKIRGLSWSSNHTLASASFMEIGPKGENELKDLVFILHINGFSYLSPIPLTRKEGLSLFSFPHTIKLPIQVDRTTPRTKIFICHSSVYPWWLPITSFCQPEAHIVPKLWIPYARDQKFLVIWALLGPSTNTLLFSVVFSPWTWPLRVTMSLMLCFYTSLLIKHQY